jgi:hypothetical protein
VNLYSPGKVFPVAKSDQPQGKLLGRQMRVAALQSSARHFDGALTQRACQRQASNWTGLQQKLNVNSLYFWMSINRKGLHLLLPFSRSRGKPRPVPATTGKSGNKIVRYCSPGQAL